MVAELLYSLCYYVVTRRPKTYKFAGPNQRKFRPLLLIGTKTVRENVFSRKDDTCHFLYVLRWESVFEMTARKFLQIFYSLNLITTGIN